MIKPNFLIIGAAKCGTTTLHEMLKDHPEIFLSEKKDFKYFDNNANYKKGEEWYADFFKGFSGEKVIGEANSEYLFSAMAAQRIKKDLGEDVKLIAIIRDPSKRAYSEYLHQIRYDNTDKSFEFYLDSDHSDLSKKDQVIYDRLFGRSMYSSHLIHFYKHFDKKNLKVVILEKLVNNPTSEIKEVYDFLDVDRNFEKQLIKANEGYVPKYQWLNNLILQPNFFRGIAKKLVPSFKTRKKIRLYLKSLNKKKASAKTSVLSDSQISFMRGGLFKNEQENVEKLANIKINEWN